MKLNFMGCGCSVITLVELFLARKYILILLKINKICEKIFLKSGSECQKSECSVLVYWFFFLVLPVGDTEK